MLILNEQEMKKISDLSQVMDQVEEAYRIFETGELYMPERFSVVQGADTLLYMPCFAGGFFGTKILTLFPDNPQRGLPYINGLYLLHERESGKALALLDGASLTAIRTGAVGGVGMRCFAAAASRSAGIIGCGTQGFYQALYACTARNIEHLYLYDNMAKDFDADMAALQAALAKPMAITVCHSTEELLANSDIVITTTTAVSPVLPDDAALLGGKCFIAIGSYKPGMRELPDTIWQVVDHVYTELPYAMEESGDLAQPLADGLITEERVRYIGRLLTEGTEPPRPGDGRSTYFKSVGMGILDLLVAELLYQRAQKLAGVLTTDL